MEGRERQFEQLLAGAMALSSEGAIDHPLAPNEEPLLNGLPYRTFRSSVSVAERRLAGTFFSGTRLARQLAARLRNEVSDTALVVDPTCGIGDLLLAYAEGLPLKETLSETVAMWGERLAGFDLNAELVQMTKARLVLLARSRGGFREGVANQARMFPRIVVGDMFQQAELINAADAFLFNPPFGMTSDYSEGAWATGQVNSAAVFLDELVKNKRAEAPIAAVLPEVLRCGSRYASFREYLEQWGLCGDYESFGRFDQWTDVDVFVSTLKASPTPLIWRSDMLPKSSIGNTFDIRVGPVVPHRHPNKGPWHPYICAKTTPRWSRSFQPIMNRRFKGTAFKPPFVVVRRTSSPSDKARAVGSIIVGERPVAVENHLIVLLPKTGCISDCERLLDLLREARTTDYLNSEMRCRHLTTGVVASIPGGLPDE